MYVSIDIYILNIQKLVNTYIILRYIHPTHTQTLNYLLQLAHICVHACIHAHTPISTLVHKYITFMNTTKVYLHVKTLSSWHWKHTHMHGITRKWVNINDFLKWHFLFVGCIMHYGHKSLYKLHQHVKSDYAMGYSFNTWGIGQ